MFAPGSIRKRRFYRCTRIVAVAQRRRNPGSGGDDKDDAKRLFLAEKSDDVNQTLSGVCSVPHSDG